MIHFYTTQGNDHAIVIICPSVNTLGYFLVFFKDGVNIISVTL